MDVLFFSLTCSFPFFFHSQSEHFKAEMVFSIRSWGVTNCIQFARNLGGPNHNRAMPLSQQHTSCEPMKGKFRHKYLHRIFPLHHTAMIIVISPDLAFFSIFRCTFGRYSFRALFNEQPY